MTYSIPEENLLALKELLAKLNKRANKLKVAPIEIKFLGTTTKMVKLKSGQDFERLYHTVEVLGTTPKLAGWSFVATLNHAQNDAGEVLTLIKCAPGVELPTTFRDAEPLCNHCNAKRNRLDTFVLQNEEGTFKQVGRNCLVDFLGGVDPQKAAASLEMLIEFVSAFSEFDERYDVGGSYNRDRTFPLKEYLLYVAAAIRAYGWVSRKTARETDTEASANIAMEVWFTTEEKAKARFRKDRAYPEPVDAEMMEKAIEWAEDTLHTRDSSTLNDYQYNLKVATSSARIDGRFVGIVASLVYAYVRAMKDLEDNAALTASKWVGEEGKRQVFAVKVIRNSPYINAFSSGTVVKAMTAEGDVIMWFDSRPSALDQLMYVKGTVKKHNEFKGVKETQINRITILTDEQAQAFAAKEARRVAREAKKAAKAAAAPPQTQEVA